MSIVRWSGAIDPFQEMEEMMKQFTGQQGVMSTMQKAFMPAMDMYETQDAVVVELPLAGIDPKNVEVSVEKGILTVQGTSKKEHEVDDKNYYRKEIRSGSFFRQVALPVAVQEDMVSAEFADGVLKVMAPKTAPTVGKKIEIKVIKKNGNGK